MAEIPFRLGLYEAKVIVPIGSFSSGTYTFILGMPAGNSLLSTIFVKELSLGAAVKVNYYDFGPGDGNFAGERIELGGHTLISSGVPKSDRKIIPRLANKPRVEIIVISGDVTIGVHIAIVSDFPSDPNLLSGQNVDLDADRGSPIMIYDTIANKWYPWSGLNGLPNVMISSLFTSGRVTEVTLNPTTWTPLPSIPLVLRKSISVQNQSGTEIKTNYNLVSGYKGMVVQPGAERIYDITENIILYAKSQSGNPTVAVEEIS